MDENMHKFLELLWYVDYIKEKKVKIQSFLGRLPQSYKDKNQFVNPQTLEETIHMATHC